MAKTQSNQPLKPIPVNRQHHGPVRAIRSWKEDVPIFDCQSNFKLSQYHHGEKIETDVNKGTIVLVIFTARRYKEAEFNVASLNVQVILRITDTLNDCDGVKPAFTLPKYMTSFGPFGVSSEVIEDDEIEAEPVEDLNEVIF
ncbi:uncharacterized protein ARMOST_07015 [Armillaria ostoyae]|uniref:Uncharacterized protein n=1 Tax=Armillaria ostoyae TaxID=47428 RepID=A0A284R4N5_ARMOS|nr:uncharacterized protein ARMOST_07015 [Armillaria ostoyae]